MWLAGTFQICLSSIDHTNYFIDLTINRRDAPGIMGSAVETESRIAVPIAVGAVILLFVAVSILFHSLICSTPMGGLTDAQWEKRLTIHSSVYPFDHRFPVTQLTVWFKKFSGWPYRQSFYFIEYLLLAITGVLFYRFLKARGFGFGSALTGLAIFLSAYPVLLGFSEPVHTWDDIWVYASLILAVGALFERRVIVSAFFFAVGLFAREQTLTLFPVFFAGVWVFGDTYSRRTRILIGVAPLLVYLPYFLPAYKATVPMEEIGSINWGTAERSANSLFSVLNSFGWLWLTWVLGLLIFFVQPANTRSRENRFLVWSSFFVVGITLASVLSIGFVRETRLFFPPFLWIIVVSLWWIEHAAQTVRKWPVWGKFLVVLTAILSIYYAMPLGKAWLPVLDYRNCEAVCQGWLGVQIGLAGFLVMLAAAVVIFRQRSGTTSMGIDGRIEEQAQK